MYPGGESQRRKLKMLTLKQKLKMIKSYPKSELLRNLENEILITDSLERCKAHQQETINKLVESWVDCQKEIEELKAEIAKLKSK